MEPYIRVGDEIVKKWAHLNLKKVYHAGETKDHLNSNVELSVRSGCVRIGHGLNIVKRIEYLNQCRHICFELNPISNLLTGGMSDIRMSPAPLLLGLGYAVSISSDDPGKFGY
jgi:adenosine deaminase